MFLTTLKPGDSVEIIAPASRCSDKHLAGIKDLLSSWQLNCIVPDNIFGNDLLCANTDETRFEMLKNALFNPQTKAVICARGGYGSTRLIPKLSELTPPLVPKIFIGMSDLTSLILFLQQKWHWPSIHGALSADYFSAESINAIKALLFTENPTFELQGIPLNNAAKDAITITAPLTGGNVCLIQTGIGTIWQMQSKDHIIFLEEVGERGYRVDRMLTHLQQAGLFREAKAIVFGDFLKGEEPNGSTLIQPVLERFANQMEIPVIQVKGVGHGSNNHPLPMGVDVTLGLGKTAYLSYQ